MGKLSKTFYSNISATSFCVSCPLCHHANDYIDIFEDKNIIIYPEKKYKIIKCESCGQELNVLATQIFQTDISDPSQSTEAIAKREAFTHPDRVRELEFTLWSLSFALFEEKAGMSSLWSSRIKEALLRARELVQHRDAEFRPLIDETPGAASLYRSEARQRKEDLD